MFTKIYKHANRKIKRTWPVLHSTKVLETEKEAAALRAAWLIWRNEADIV